MLESETSAPVKIIFKIPGEFLRILCQVPINVSIGSFATERYLSRTLFQISEYAGKYMVQPTAD